MQMSTEIWNSMKIDGKSHYNEMGDLLNSLTQHGWVLLKNLFVPSEAF